MGKRFKKGDIVYIAQEDSFDEYYPEKCEVIGIFDKSLFKDGAEDIYLLAINKKRLFKKNDISIVHERESQIFESLRSARIHCDILNYGVK